MRILFITNNYTPYSGGVVSSIQATVGALQALGHEVQIVTLNFLGAKHQDPPYVHRVPSLLRFVYKNNRMAMPWRAKRHLRAIITRFSPDVIHVHHPFLLGWLGAQLGRRLSIPIVFTYHTLYEHYAHYVPAPELLVKFIIRRQVEQFCRYVDGIVLPSNAMHSHVGPTRAATLVLPSGLNQHFVDLPFRPHTIAEHNTIRLLLVSRFAPEKNIEWLLDVMILLRFCNVELTLVGHGAEYERLQFYAYRQLHLQETVIFVHKPTPQELLACYKRADIFLFPSTSDTQGLVLAEAMACGKPVVALDGPGQRDIIRDGYNGYIVKTKKQMADRIIDIARDRKLYKHLQDGAWHTGRDYDPLFLTRKLLTFYQGLLKKFIPEDQS
jgi:1,2-diacylglycerol 3-alpha-glucosyltransferase